VKGECWVGLLRSPCHHVLVNLCLLLYMVDESVK